MEQTSARLKKWQDNLKSKLEKVEIKAHKDWTSSLAKMKHTQAQINGLRQKISDLETAIKALDKETKCK